MGWSREIPCAPLAFGLCILVLYDTAYAALDKCDISTDCVAALVRDMSSVLESGAPNGTYSAANSTINEFSKCLGVEPALRPLRILAPDQGKEALEPRAHEFQDKTGYRVIFDYVDIPNLAMEVMLALQQNPLLYDGWVIDPTSIVDISTLGGLQPLDTFISNDEDIDWTDITRFMREVSLTYNSSIIGLPMSGKTSTLYYRKDVFAAHNISVPNTWPEFLDIARAFNGSDFNADNMSDYSLCWQTVDCLEKFVVLPQILTSMTQTQGTKSGWLLDPVTLDSVVRGEAMQAALSLYRELMGFVAPGRECTFVHSKFVKGECLMTIKWDELFKMTEVWEPAMHGRVGVAILPGWTDVVDQSGKLQPCTKATCPYATEEVAKDGSVHLVNRAPYFGYGGFAGSVNPFQSHDYMQATYNFFSYVASTNVSTLSLPKANVVGPFRTSHLDVSPGALQRWVQGGFDAGDVRGFLRAQSLTLESRNIALDLRIINGYKYMAVLGEAADNSTSMQPLQIMEVMDQKFKQILHDSGDFNMVRRSYWAGLGIAAPPNVMPRVASLPPGPASSPTTSNPSSSGNDSWHTAVIATCVLGGLVILALAGLAVFMWHRGTGLWSRTPRAAADTTIVVTDIMESTQLWESLSQDTMDRAVGTHHAIIRRLLSKHAGYEVATEGDSFLLSFNAPDRAIRFSLELQAALLAAPWEEELLQHPICAPVWLAAANDSVPCAGDSSSWKGTFPACQDIMTVMASPSQGELDAEPLSLLRVKSSAWGSLSNMLDVQSKPGVVGSVRRNPDMPSPHHAAVAATLLNMAEHLEAGQTRVGVELSQAPESILSCISVASYLQHAWKVVEAPASQSLLAAELAPKLAIRGLRVRVGMHSGVDKSNLVHNKAAGRLSYTGYPLAMAKATCDAAQGGMVLLSASTFMRLHMGDKDVSKLLRDVTMACVGEYALKDQSMPPAVLYQALTGTLLPSVGLLGLPRSPQRHQLGIMEAPLGRVTIVFANLVGVSTLLAWNHELASRSLDLYHARASQELERVGGYMVELTGGLCLASFTKPLDAVAFGVSLIEELKNEDWPDELLSHELCEEVALEDGGSEFFQRCATSSSNLQLNGGSAPVTLAASADSSSTLMRSSHLSRHKVILFRGPRYKVGIDIGTVSGDMSAVTGRLNYRGKVMNRAARIAERAFSGQCWCSAGVWECSLSDERFEQPDCNLQFRELGQHLLKGVQEPMQLVQCSLRSSAPVSAVRTPGTSTRYSACASHRAPASNLGSHRSSHSYEGQRPPPLSVPQSTMSPKPSMRILPSKMFTNPLAHIPSLKMQSTLTRSPQVKGTGASKRHVMFGPIDIESGSEPEARTPPHGMASREMSMTSTPVVPEESESM